MVVDLHFCSGTSSLADAEEAGLVPVAGVQRGGAEGMHSTASRWNPLVHCPG